MKLHNLFAQVPATASGKDRFDAGHVTRTKILTIAVAGALIAIPSGLMADKAKAKWKNETATPDRISPVGNVFEGGIRKASFSRDVRKVQIATPLAPELKLTAALTRLPRNNGLNVEPQGENNATLSTREFSSGSGYVRLSARLRYVEHIQAAANKTQLDPALIHAVIAVESNHNTLALSNKGALGLMQLMPQTAARYGVENRMDPVQNIDGGARYLADLVRMFEGDVQLALAAYNAGEHVVIRYGNQIPPYRETMAYVPRVLGYYEKYKSTLYAASAIPDALALNQTF